MECIDEPEAFEESASNKAAVYVHLIPASVSYRLSCAIRKQVDVNGVISSSEIKLVIDTFILKNTPVLEERGSIHLPEGIVEATNGMGD